MQPIKIIRKNHHQDGCNGQPLPPRNKARHPTVKDTMRLSEVTARPIAWLWQGWIPRGTPTLLTGMPNSSKSMFSLEVAARVSTGTALPDGSRSTAGDVLLITTEDGIADTQKPRLLAAGANPNRIHFLSLSDPSSGIDGPFDLKRDHDRVRKVLQSLDKPVLLVIDPLSAYLGAADLYRDDSIRKALAPYCRMAAEFNIAMLLVTHLNKRNRGGIAQRFNGSIGLAGLARQILLVQDCPGEPGSYFLSTEKSNISTSAAVVQHYSMEEIEVEGGIKAPRIVWKAPLPRETVEAFMQCSSPTPSRVSRVEQAKQWLIVTLTGRSVSATEVKPSESSEALPSAPSNGQRRSRTSSRRRRRERGFGPCRIRWTNLRAKIRNRAFHCETSLRFGSKNFNTAKIARAQCLADLAVMIRNS